jgi:hypothetical protein
MNTELMKFLILRTLLLLKADQVDSVPVDFGSGFLLKYNNKEFVVTAAHLFDTNTIKVLIHLGNRPFQITRYNLNPFFFKLFELRKIKKYIAYFKKDFSISEITKKKKDYDLAILDASLPIKPIYDFPNRLATGLDKIVIESELNVKPDPNESYCFYSMGNYTKDENENISLKEHFEFNLKFKEKRGEYLVFTNISDPEYDFHGSSGAPMFNSKNELISMIIKPGNCKTSF